MSAMMLRSAVASGRSEEAANAFREGVRSIFRQWTALDLAVHHGWGGHSSQEKAERLVDDVLALFESPQRIYKDVCL